jgi:hypothetical protein
MRDLFVRINQALVAKRCGTGQAKGRALRASLASATSLLALLLLEGREAAADPIIKAGTPIPFYYALGRTGEAGTDTVSPVDAPESYMFTPLTTGVASSTGGYSESSPYFGLGQSVLARLASSATDLANTTDGELSNLHRTSSPNRAISAGNSVFVGTSQGFALLDEALALPSAASASFGYTISPAAKGAAAANAATVAADGDDQTQIDGAATEHGSRVETVVVTPAGAGTPGYTYAPFGTGTPASAAPAAFGNGVSGGGVSGGGISGGGNSGGGKVSQPGAAKSPDGGRVFSGSTPGASVFDTHEPAATALAGPASSSTLSRARHNEAVKAFYLMLQQAAGDANPGDAVKGPALAAEGYAPAKADASSFTVSFHPSSSIVTREVTVPVPIRVVGAGGGELPSSLAIFSADATALDAGNDLIAYPLD